MKKSTMEAIYNVLNNGATITDELRAEFNAEFDRSTAKSRANAVLYANAHDALMDAEGWDHPMTAEEIATEFADILPEGFTKSKIQYAFRAMWADEIVKRENGKNPLTYSRK